MNQIVLHPYQQKLKAGIYSDWQHGAKNTLAVLPTGGGKSVVVSDIVLDGALVGMTQSIIAHRNELVSQMSMHIARRGIPHCIVGPVDAVAQITRMHRKEFGGQSFINPSARTSVVGVDTLVSRHKKDPDGIASWALQHDRWITDEAHHVIRTNKWGTAVNLFSNAQGLGVTATPQRADGQGLGREYDGVFDTMVEGPGMRDLIEWGNLSDYEIVCPLSDLQMHEEDIAKGGDYSPEKLKAAAKESKIVGDVVAAYCRYAFGKSAICFATDTETAGNIAANFNAVGIRAAALSGLTPTAVREKFVTEFRAGILTVLVNVDLFDEGFDVPSCDCVIMARPTASLGKYLQMVGRGLRVYQGKLYGLIIDHVSNVIRHKLPDKPRVWTLARRDKRGKQEKDPEDIPMTVCKNKTCLKPYERFHPVCPYCGSLPPLPESRERSIEMVDGDLILLDRTKLEEMRRATELESPGSIGSRIGDAWGGPAGQRAVTAQMKKVETQRRLSDAIAQWAALERAKGRADQETYRRFYLTTGMDVLSAMSVENTWQDYEALAVKVEGWFMK